jgi:RNA polymerase sporulation-specific sigma factor
MFFLFYIRKRRTDMQKLAICGIREAGLPKLTNKENEELMLRAKAGDRQAREKLIEGNLRLVLSLMKRFRSRNACQDDLFQAGSYGLIKAIDNFDVSIGVRFSTYAVPMVIGEMKRFLRDGNSLRISRSIRDMAYRVLKAREEIESRDEEATIEKIAAALQVAEREVVYALDAISDPVSIYEPVYNKAGDTLLLMDQLCDEKNTDEIWTEHVALSEAMGKLGERERKILYLRYYQGKTQTEISEEVGISQAQVSRLEKGALEHMRKQF